MTYLKHLPFLALLTVLSACSQVDTIEFTTQNSTDLSDNDGDGVISIRDKCPESPPHAKVDSNGCEHWLDDDNFKEFFIFFDTNSSTIPIKIQNDLITLSKYLKSNSKTYAVIEGHTSDTGSNEVNNELQLKRASSVKEFLSNEGVSINQIYLAPQGDHSSRIITDSKADDTINQRVYLSTHLLEKNIASQWDMLTPPEEDKGSKDKQGLKE